MTLEEELKVVIYVGWIESEKGWGSRPDGCSLHLTRDDAEIFIKQYWDGMPKVVPDEYSYPGKKTYAYVSQDLYKRTQKTDHGLWLTESSECYLLDKGELKRI